MRNYTEKEEKINREYRARIRISEPIGQIAILLLAIGILAFAAAWIKIRLDVD